MGIGTISLAAVGLCLLVFGIFSLFRKEREEKGSEVVISLADLSALWLGSHGPSTGANMERVTGEEEYPVRERRTSKDRAGMDEESRNESLPPAIIATTKSFWDECVAPYLKVIEVQGARSVVEDLMRLIEEQGHHPSVAAGVEDAESADLYSVKDSLAKVSIKDHSFSVVRIMVDMARQGYADSESMTPLVIVTGLAHDIGKIPEYRLTGIYNTHEHALVSMNKLQELFTGLAIPWQRAALAAVRDHHSRSNDQFTALLKAADQKARSYELVQSLKGYELLPFERWFDAGRFLREYVRPGVNVAQTNKWQAFTLKGCVFVRPEFLYEAAKKMCREMRVLEVGFVYETEQDGMIRRIVTRLREGGHIHEMLPQGRSSLYFELKTSVGGGRKVKAALTPLTGDAFDNLEMEKRKTDFLSILDDVVIS
jgi:hypothetical protein